MWRGWMERRGRDAGSGTRRRSWDCGSASNGTGSAAGFSKTAAKRQDARQRKRAGLDPMQTTWLLHRRLGMSFQLGTVILAHRNLSKAHRHGDMSGPAPTQAQGPQAALPALPQTQVGAVRSRQRCGAAPRAQPRRRARLSPPALKSAQTLSPSQVPLTLCNMSKTTVWDFGRVASAASRSSSVCPAPPAAPAAADELWWHVVAGRRAFPLPPGYRWDTRLDGAAHRRGLSRDDSVLPPTHHPLPTAGPLLTTTAGRRAPPTAAPSHSLWRAGRWARRQRRRRPAAAPAQAPAAAAPSWRAAAPRLC